MYPRSESERTAIEQFNQSYRYATSAVIGSIERSVCGCAYGGTSWTTREEAEGIAQALALAPGKRLLEVGAGAGWPSLYLAKLTGCSAVLVDLPLEGLRVASERIEADGLGERCFVAQADGAALPLKGQAFDAISHSDVLCCLTNKLGVLRECRNAVRESGRMAFTVIFVAASLGAEDYAEALAAGPQFVETETDYEAMLAHTGWRLASRVDLTQTFANSMKRMVEAREAHADQLAELMGALQYEEMITQMRAKLPATKRGLLERAMFVAEPV
jgi:cyclopropane fatty-acyl-phospholipid synthase-like methyltransferase